MQDIWALLGDKWFILVGWLIAFGLGILPVFHYLIFGLQERRKEVLGYFKHRSIVKYFKQFYPKEWTKLSKEKEEKISSAFERIYDERFGLKTFMLPLILYFVSLATTVGAIAYTVVNKGPGLDGVTLDETGEFALAGAYLWVAYDLISRYRQRDLVPSALYWYSFRFVICIPLAYVLLALPPVVASAVAAPTAFALGAFPTETLMLILRRNVLQRLGLGDNTENKPLELEELQGINTTIAEKLAEIGVKTTLLLAYEDPIQLTMRTNLSFNFITDVVSQALATIYGLNLKVTRAYSVRGAFEASEVIEEYEDASDPEAKACADVVISQLADKLDIPREIVRKILRDIQNDPYTDFLREIWA
jgi:hypothetical protein